MKMNKSFYENYNEMSNKIDGITTYKRNGVYHRLDGPAIILDLNKNLSNSDLSETLNCDAMKTKHPIYYENDGMVKYFIIAGYCFDKNKYDFIIRQIKIKRILRK